MSHDHDHDQPHSGPDLTPSGKVIVPQRVSQNNGLVRDKLSRRIFLGGAGVAMALPFLPSMFTRSERADAQAGVCSPAKRFLGYYVPCGIHMAEWTPNRDGRGFDLKRITEPLADVQEHVALVTGLENFPARPDGPGDHASGTGAFMTAAHPFKSESVIRNGISIDQVIANHYAECTSLPSLQLGIDGGGNAGGCDSGYSCAYSRNVSWADETTPLSKTIDPQVAFDRLFGGFDPGASVEEIERRKRLRASVLDYVNQDARRLSSRLAPSDKLKLDQFLTGVRQLELRVQMIEPDAVCDIPTRPGGGLSFQEKIDVFNELMVMAFHCDRTRVISFMFGNGGSNRNFDFVGAAGGHHTLSHHDSDPSNFEKLTRIGRFEIEQVASLIRRLRDTEDLDGSSLLDNTTVFFSSEISDGNRHNHDDMPILLAGRGAGIEMGRHVRFAGKPPVADLFTRIAQGSGVTLPRFGDGSGPLSI